MIVVIGWTLVTLAIIGIIAHFLHYYPLFDVELPILSVLFDKVYQQLYFTIILTILGMGIVLLIVGYCHVFH